MLIFTIYTNSVFSCSIFLNLKNRASPSILELSVTELITVQHFFKRSSRSRYSILFLQIFSVSFCVSKYVYVSVVYENADKIVCVCHGERRM